MTRLELKEMLSEYRRLTGELLTKMAIIDKTDSDLREIFLLEDEISKLNAIIL